MLKLIFFFLEKKRFEFINIVKNRENFFFLIDNNKDGFCLFIREMNYYYFFYRLFYKDDKIVLRLIKNIKYN